MFQYHIKTNNANLLEPHGKVHYPIVKRKWVLLTTDLGQKAVTDIEGVIEVVDCTIDRD